MGNLVRGDLWGMCASAPQASLHTDAFKLSLPFLEAPRAVFRAQRHNLHARPLKKLWGSALGVGFSLRSAWTEGLLQVLGGGTWEQDATLCQEAGTLPKEVQGYMAQGLCTSARAHHAHPPQPCFGSAAEALGGSGRPKAVTQIASNQKAGRTETKPKQ